MIFKKLHELIGSYINLVERYAARFWFPPLLGLLALLDNLIIVIPNEGILISSSMVVPKRWLIFAISVAIGSTLGALLIVGIVKLEGLPLILKFFPAIHETHLWSLTLKFFVQYGLILIFVIGLTP